MHRATEELRRCGLAERALKVGDLAPAFELDNQDGQLVRPADLIANGPLGFFLNHPDVELKIPGALRETASLVASGVTRVPIAATYPLTAFREAVAHVQRGGKVMFDVSR